MPAPVGEIMDVGGARLWTVTEGTGRPVVWCHGGPGGVDKAATTAHLSASAGPSNQPGTQSLASPA